MAISIPTRAFARAAGEKSAEEKLDSRLLQLSEDVGQRWEARAPMRKQRAASIAEGHSLAVETPDRLARVNRLLGEVRRKSRDLRPPRSTTLGGPGEIQSYGWLPLDGQQGKLSLVPEDMINIIQHPPLMPRNLPLYDGLGLL